QPRNASSPDGGSSVRPAASNARALHHQPYHRDAAASRSPAGTSADRSGVPGSQRGGTSSDGTTSLSASRTHSSRSRSPPSDTDSRNDGRPSNRTAAPRLVVVRPASAARDAQLGLAQPLLVLGVELSRVEPAVRQVRRLGRAGAPALTLGGLARVGRVLV